MNPKNLRLYITTLLISVITIGLVFALPKTPTTGKTTSDSTFHSLSDIYNLITTGSTSTPSSPVSTSSSPTATTSHSTSEIYLLLANTFKSENLRPGNSLLGITGSYGTSNPEYTEATSQSASLAPTVEPGTPTGFSLEDIYNLINSNTRVTESNHTFSSSPQESMYTTT